MRSHPPDILITTPESLYLILTSAAREVLGSVETVIVDEIHALASGKRGTHLALSLERLARLTGADPQRIGLSATQRPLEEIARFLGGDRPVEIVDAGHRKPLDLEVMVPVEDMRELGGAPAVDGEPRQSIWPAIYPRLLELVRAHRSTLVFVNNRRSAERVAHRLNDLAGEEIARAHHGSIAREQRLEVEDMLKSGRMPFWKGDGVGRPYELGRAVGEAARTRRFGDLDELAAQNLHAYLDDQAAATGAVPSDRTIVIERFRDEIGDWRLCVLSPFGGRVHAPWALAVERRLGEALGIEVEAMWSDDGIAIRLPDSDTPPPVDLVAIPPDDLDDLLIERVSESPLFAGRFRENAARALLIPRRRPGRRTPLWQQRLKAHDLQQVAQKYGSFPVLLETYREVLSDVFEVPALKGLLRAIAGGEVRVVEVESAVPSPFASSLLFDYIATYMYEGDAPAAERRAQALQLDRALLAELLRSEDLRELLDADAIRAVQAELQGEGGTLTPDRTHDLVRRLGDLSRDELEARGASGVDLLVAERRAAWVRIAGEERLIAAEDAGLYRDGLGVATPPGLPAAYLEPVAGALERLVLRHARTHGPFTADDLRRRWGMNAIPVLRDLAARGELLEGEFRPDGAGTEWVAADVLRRVRRRALPAGRPGRRAREAPGPA